jgi:hypothetical protein
MKFRHPIMRVRELMSATGKPHIRLASNPESGHRYLTISYPSDGPIYVSTPMYLGVSRIERAWGVYP